ncbi:MAG TPA: sigma 54-interacting transcriptional regulator [Polyangiaceae bacterium]|nr:sigma 54-interacting transcriptional regulator [Polyangiaceae bacterium]
MAVEHETRDDSGRMTAPRARPQAGIVVMLAAERPAASAFEIGPAGLILGRGSPAGVLDGDERISRRHARLSFREGPRGITWTVEDLESRNGTYVDGRRLAAQGTFEKSALVRLGRSLIWAVDDVRPLLGHAPVAPARGGPVVGGYLRRAFGEVALASRSSDTLLILGESGAGKELAARAFHDARRAPASRAPFVAVNCAAIPEGLAERLLFGARKGAFSGATQDADGYVQEADGGTLFLDEIAELDPLVQAKLLRVLETREVLPLGASRPRSVDIGICAASHRRLRDEVAAGRFREDLYYRIGRPEVVVPPLRERLDEIPWFIASLLGEVDANLTASIGFVEACALRPWPGNVRELKHEVVRAAHRALEEGAKTVETDHLLDDAGAAVTSDGPGRKEGITRWSEEEIRRALAAHGGNVRATARALDVHRNQLRRWLEKHGAARAAGPDALGDAAEAPSGGPPYGQTLPPDDEP